MAGTLFTGRHMLVGLSNRMNGGMTFCGRRSKSTSTYQGDQFLHLKSVVTHLDETTLLVPYGAVGESVLVAMQASSLGCEAVRLPDILACNAVVVNGHILAQDVPCHDSRDILAQVTQEKQMCLSFVNTSELAKKNGALTCCSILSKI
jgi:dimethylargininase